MTSRLNVVDLFCGCGGASLGLKSAGHRIIAAVDLDPIACKTYKENVGFDPIQADLRTLSGTEILAYYGINKDEVDLLVGCPPCQGFSSLRRTSDPTGHDPRKSLVSVFLQRIKELQPRAVIFENVSGIRGKIGIEYYTKFICRMEKWGYKTNDGLINTADYGIPQFRKRAIVLCTKGNKVPIIPHKTHNNPQKLKGNELPWKTVKDAIGDLPPLKPGESCSFIPNHYARNHLQKTLELIDNIPKDGGSRKDLPKEMWLPCHLKLTEGAESVYGRMSWSKPSPTITCRCTTPSSGRFLHPEQNRVITIREAARLQTFPDTVIFPNNLGWAERLIGNAVPPALIKQLSEVLENSMD